MGLALRTAQAARDDLEALRRRADAALDARTVAAADPARWLAASTRFIEALVALGRDALYGHDLPSELVRAYSLRQSVWVVSEYAGRERGWLAYYLSARRPPPQAVREQLRVFRNMTLIAARELERRATDPAIEPAVRAAAAEMRKRYLEDFEPARARAHAAIAGGAPALGGLEWFERATQAIDSVLAVSGAVAAQSRRQLESLRRSSLWRLSGGIAFLMLSLGAAFASLTHVRGLVNQMFREKELVQVTMDSIGDAVITTDLAMRVEYLNPVAEALTGWTLGEARGRPLREVFNIVNGYNRESRESPVERCLRKGHVVGLGN
ncbi:MAG: nitrate- and nitrite sensing domain-containing protein, partial [Pseudomonadota bacterium]